ncbi:hypothetical protein U3516DRAFT_759955 [Neocallimastix sp. 'constans']
MKAYIIISKEFDVSISRAKQKLKKILEKQLPPDIITFYEIPDESEYHKTEIDESIVLFLKYNDIFADGTFCVAPKFSYTTSFSILRISYAAEKVYPNIKNEILHFSL